MKRAYLGLVESRSPRSVPRVSAFLDGANSKVDVLLGNSLLKGLSRRIEADRGPHLAHGGFRRALGSPHFCSQHGSSIVRLGLDHGGSATKTLDPPEEDNRGRRVD
jgi:hypothetical protein